MPSKLDAILCPVEIQGLEQVLLEQVRAEVARQLAERPSGWLDVDGAAAYLAMTPKALRCATAKGLPCHRTPSGRLRYRAAELDAWVESGS